MDMVAIPREAHERLIKAAQDVCQAPCASSREAAISELRRAGEAFDEAMKLSGYKRSHPHGLFAAKSLRRDGVSWTV